MHDDQLIDRADLAAPVAIIWVTKEQIRREGNAIAQCAAEDRVHRHAPALPHDVEAGELQGREHLRAVVVE